MFKDAGASPLELLAVMLKIRLLLRAQLSPQFSFETQVLPVLRRDQFGHQQLPRFVKGNQPAVEKCIQVGPQEQPVVRIEPFPIRTHAPWLDMRCSKQSRHSDACNSASAIPAL